MKCAVCGAANDWLGLDHLRVPEARGFVICRGCGFATYRDLADESLKDFYRDSNFNQARRLAGSDDLRTKLRKLVIHRAFLGQHLADKKNLSIVDIGCSTGYLLKMCRDEYGHGQVCGTEWNPAHAAFARRGYGLEVREDIADFGERRYDLICLEKVLEHVLLPDVFLSRLVDRFLAEDGRICLSVPIWFDILGPPSLVVLDGPGLEGILVPDHINIFSLNAIRALISRAGLVAEQENYSYYGYRALLVRGKGQEISRDDCGANIDSLERQKKALELFRKGDFTGAAGCYERFPEAVARDIHQRGNGDNAWMLAAFAEKRGRMPNVHQFAWQIGSLYFEMGDYPAALRAYKEAIELAPQEIAPYWQCAEVHLRLGDFAAAAEAYEQLLFNYPQLQFEPIREGFPSCLDRLSYCYSEMG